MIPFYCAGNWKMNKSAAEAQAFVQHFKREVTDTAVQERVVIFPPALVAHTVAEELRGTSVSWGGQNCHFETKGAFTGENSPQILKEMGARYALVGHSERRQLFGEADDLLAKKVKGLQALSMTPVLCVGETSDDRRWTRTAEVILRQLRSALAVANPQQPLWLAYEPVWAIGTGVVATPEQVEEAHEILRKALREWNPPAAERTPILYGGSVKLDNVASLASLKNVNGFLIGGASLNATEFVQIQKAASHSRS